MFNPLNPTIELVLADGTKVSAKYPNVGEKLEIESRKILYSKGIYGELARNNTIASDRLLNVIDAFAYLSICAPDLKITIDSFYELSEPAAVALVKVFKLQYYKWYADIEMELYKVDESINRETAAEAKANK